MKWEPEDTQPLPVITSDAATVDLGVNVPAPKRVQSWYAEAMSWGSRIHPERFDRFMEIEDAGPNWFGRTALATKAGIRRGCAWLSRRVVSLWNRRVDAARTNAKAGRHRHERPASIAGGVQDVPVALPGRRILELPAGRDGD